MKLNNEESEFLASLLEEQYKEEIAKLETNKTDEQAIEQFKTFLRKRRLILSIKGN